MIRGTTPKMDFVLPFDVDSIAESYITFVQNNNIVFDKSFSECESHENTLTLRLTQEETLKLSDGNAVEIQIRVRTKSGEAMASNIIRVNTERILRDGVI